MRKTILLAGMLAAIAACSERTDPAADAIEPRATPDLALTHGTDDAPVVSDIESYRAPDEPAPAPGAEPRRAAPAVVPEPEPERAEPQFAAVPDPSSAESHDGHVHVEEGSVSGPAPGGGKPMGVLDGLGTVPDRGWGDPTIYDDPDPLPGIIGRTGAVIIRGGAGGVDDDCAIHPRGGIAASPGPADALVNDRAPRRGVAINDRAPRTRPGGSMPRGAGFPGRGIR